MATFIVYSHIFRSLMQILPTTFWCCLETSLASSSEPSTLTLLILTMWVLYNTQHTQHSNCMAIYYSCRFMLGLIFYVDHKSVWQWTQVYPTTHGLTSLQVSDANTPLCIVFWVTWYYIGLCAQWKFSDEIIGHKSLFQVFLSQIFPCGPNRTECASFASVFCAVGPSHMISIMSSYN